ncbi:hypothetical protein AAZX31_15G151900 [Glycine max]|uniref:Uncharacterized protein n=1 Tax=Glycine soja TaxID=3848 RepID=A0A0B2SS53_GLYSO|nr:hypothetical protein glysoja_026389 [Glycine soja]RZB64830.1 hypothetical protein D0Y65_041062 [Glycine soja]
MSSPPQRRNDSEKELDSTCNHLGYTNNCASPNGSRSSPPQNDDIGGSLGYRQDPAGKTGSKASQSKSQRN